MRADELGMSKMMISAFTEDYTIAAPFVMSINDMFVKFTIQRNLREDATPSRIKVLFNGHTATLKLDMIDDIKAFIYRLFEEEFSLTGPPDWEMEMEACITCGTQQNLQVCTGCSKAAYCSLECQAKNWTIHEANCETK